jgi:hypothetical protein
MVNTTEENKPEPQDDRVSGSSNCYDESEPIHHFFALSYAQYLTIPRSALQSMPIEWQRRFVQCLSELGDAIDWRPQHGIYRVRLFEVDHDARYSEDEDAKYWVREIDDPLMDYDRGRRRIEVKIPTS